MDLILLSDELYHLVEVTKEMTKGIELLSEMDCFDLCDILRLHLTTLFLPTFVLLQVLNGIIHHLILLDPFF